VCSEVCPYGGAAPDLATRFGTHAALREGTLARWLALAPAALAAEVAGSPLTRAGSHGLARNAALVLGNHPSEVGRSALVQALEHPAGLVREAAFWALSTAHASDAGIGARLARARDVETDAAARGGMERTLALSSGHDAPS
jgi:epoxyqueuosine reductase QueG